MSSGNKKVSSEDNTEDKDDNNTLSIPCCKACGTILTFKSTECPLCEVQNEPSNTILSVSTLSDMGSLNYQQIDKLGLELLSVFQFREIKIGCPGCKCIIFAWINNGEICCPKCYYKMFYHKSITKK